MDIAHLYAPQIRPRDTENKLTEIPTNERTYLSSHCLRKLTGGTFTHRAIN